MEGPEEVESFVVEVGLCTLCSDGGRDGRRYGWKEGKLGNRSERPRERFYMSVTR